MAEGAQHIGNRQPGIFRGLYNRIFGSRQEENPDGSTRTTTPTTTKPGQTLNQYADTYIPTGNRQRRLPSVPPERQPAEFHSAEMHLQTAMEETQVAEEIRGVISRFVQQASESKGDNKKLLELVDDIDDFIRQIKAKPVGEQKILVEYIRKRFYQLAQNARSSDMNNLYESGVLMTILARDPELKMILMPRNDGERNILRQFTGLIMQLQSVMFKREFIDSGRFKWAWEAGYSYVDGRVPNASLSCIQFAFEFARTVLNTGTIRTVGRSQVVNMGNKVAEDLRDMFDVELAPTIDLITAADYARGMTPEQQRILLADRIKQKIAEDVGRDGFACYLCQAYGLGGHERSNGKHSFVIVAFRGDNGEPSAFVYESTPWSSQPTSPPRVISLADKFNHSRYYDLHMVNLMPASPEQQIEYLSQGIFGENVPLGQRASR